MDEVRRMSKSRLTANLLQVTPFPWQPGDALHRVPKERESPLTGDMTKVDKVLKLVRKRWQYKRKYCYGFNYFIFNGCLQQVSDGRRISVRIISRDSLWSPIRLTSTWPIWFYPRSSSGQMNSFLITGLITHCWLGSVVRAQRAQKRFVRVEDNILKFQRLNFTPLVFYLQISQ